MATIAAEAGLGRNTIHRHFATRQHLIDAVRLQASDDSAANDDDHLRPPGELGALTPSTLSVSDVLNKVPPFELGTQIVAEAQRLAGVASAAIYIVDLDGAQLRRLAGAKAFPESLPIDLALGPEIPRDAVAALRATIEHHLPGTTVAPMYLRGRAIGVLLAIGTDERNIRELAQEAAAALSLAERYTDQGARVRRARPTSPAAELQQNLLPPRIVRIGGATLAGNVLPGYDIGGDWFDYTDNPEGAWLGIADTHGNGPRAAATAAVLLGAFRAARHLDTATPATAIRLMHETVLELSDIAIPVSATVAIWNGASAILQWIACGDSQPILIHATDRRASARDRRQRLPSPAAHPEPPAHRRPADPLRVRRHPPLRRPHGPHVRARGRPARRRARRRRIGGDDRPRDRGRGARPPPRSVHRRRDAHGPLPERAPHPALVQANVVASVTAASRFRERARSPNGQSTSSDWRCASLDPRTSSTTTVA